MTADIGDRLPALTLRDQAGRPVRLRTLQGQPTVLFFYPRAFTPGCTKEACDFRDAHAALARAGYAVVGVSPDPVDRLQPFQAEHGLPYPLLSDPDHALAAALGAWGKKTNYGREVEGLIRSTVVLDAQGRILRIYRNVRAAGHVARLTRDLLGAGTA